VSRPAPRTRPHPRLHWSGEHRPGRRGHRQRRAGRRRLAVDPGRHEDLPRDGSTDGRLRIVVPLHGRYVTRTPDSQHEGRGGCPTAPLTPMWLPRKPAVTLGVVAVGVVPGQVVTVVLTHADVAFRVLGGGLDGLVDVLGLLGVAHDDLLV